MKYLLILTIALLVGIGCALPNILGYLEFKEKYEPFSHLFTSAIQYDEITFYGPGASYFKEELSLPFEIDIYEYRNKPVLRYFLPDIIEGALGYLFKDLRLAWGFIHFIFPLISFLLVYFLAKELTNEPLAACFSAVLFCTLGFGPRSFMNLYKEHIAQPVLFSRINSPAVTLPFLLVALIGLVKIQQRHFKIGVILAGIFGGLLFYVYYHYQTTYIFTLILLTLFFMMLKKWDIFLRILLTAIITNIIALPWYLQYLYTLKLSPQFISLFMDMPFNLKSFKIRGCFIFILLLLLVYFLSKLYTRKDRLKNFPYSKYLPIYALILAAILLQFIVSPYIFSLIMPAHFLQHIAYGFSLFVISCIMGNKLLLRSPRYKLPIIISICTLVTLLFVKQFIVWQTTKRYFKVNPSERVAEELMRKYTTHKDVIAISDPYLNSVFSTRIWRFKFYTGSTLSNRSYQENLQRYLFIQKIFNRPWEYIDRKFSSKEDTDLAPLEVMTIPFILGFGQDFAIKERRQELIKIYRSLSKTFLVSRKIDYLLCLSSEDEKNLLLGAEKLGINIYLAEKDSGAALYKLKN